MRDLPIGDLEIYLFDDASDLGFEAHVEHSIGFVEAEEAAELESDFAALQKVYQTARRGHQQMAAAGELAHLLAAVRTAINDTRSHLKLKSKSIRVTFF